MKKVRATKKACGSIETELTKDFIDRALNSNPREILTNELLKMEFLFGEEPLPEFEAYNSPYSKELLEKVFKSKQIRGRKYLSRIKRLFLIFSIREDISNFLRLQFATASENKKYVRKFVQYYPDFKDFDFVLNLYLNDKKNKALFKESSEYRIFNNYIKYNQWSLPTNFFMNDPLNPAYALEFYSKLVEDDQTLYDCFKKYLSVSTPFSGTISLFNIVHSLIPFIIKDNNSMEIILNLYKIFLNTPTKHYDTILCKNISLDLFNSYKRQTNDVTAALKMLIIFTEWFNYKFNFNLERELSSIMYAETIKVNRRSFTSALKLYIDEMCPGDHMTFSEKYQNIETLCPKLKWLSEDSHEHSNYFKRSVETLSTV